MERSAVPVSSEAGAPEAPGWESAVNLNVLLAAWRRHRKQPFFPRRREVAPTGFLEDSSNQPKPALAEGD
jgi:hypothetical protein